MIKIQAKLPRCLLHTPHGLLLSPLCVSFPFVPVFRDLRGFVGSWVCGFRNVGTTVSS